MGKVNRIKVIDDTSSICGPWLGEFGSWESVMDGKLTNEECEILDNSAGKYEILKCKLENITFDKLKHGCKFLELERSNGDIETWVYSGQSRVIPEECFSYFTRPLN